MQTDCRLIYIILLNEPRSLLTCPVHLNCLKNNYLEDILKKYNGIKIILCFFSHFLNASWWFSEFLDIHRACLSFASVIYIFIEFSDFRVRGKDVITELSEKGNFLVFLFFFFKSSSIQKVRYNKHVWHFDFKRAYFKIKKV